jgi:hypothetical protein
MEAPERIWLDTGFQPWRVWPMDMPGCPEYVRADTLAARRMAELEGLVKEAMDGDPAVSAAKVLYAFCCDPWLGDKESEAWRAMNWQALYRSMQEDDGDIPAMVGRWLEAFAYPDEAEARAERLEAALRLADDALTEAEAILGGEYGDHYGPLCDTMLKLRGHIAALQQEDK